MSAALHREDLYSLEEYARIRPDFRPSEPPAQATHLLVYRNRDDDVKFMQLNAITQRLLEMLDLLVERRS